MNYEIKHGPSFASLFLNLDTGEQVRTEAGAMVGMSTNLSIKTKAYGGFLKALIRKLVGGESIFQNTYTAEGGAGEIIVSPTLPGSIKAKTLAKGQPFILQASAFLACTPDVTLKTKYGGLKALMSGEGLFLLQAGGEGELWFNSYGNIIEIDVDGEYIVDTGHIVAFEDGLSFKVKKVGGLKSLLLSGEGFVANFKGKGKLYIQSRTVSSLVGWIAPMLPAR
ncbi:MAG TPA: TIGR00266 family protein [bacterium]|nr:TIGR00266 family protein [bacterium]